MQKLAQKYTNFYLTIILLIIMLYKFSLQIIVFLYLYIDTIGKLTYNLQCKYEKQTQKRESERNSFSESQLFAVVDFFILHVVFMGLLYIIL